jgi:hypothetical protein
MQQEKRGRLMVLEAMRSIAKDSKGGVEGQVVLWQRSFPNTIPGCIRPDRLCILIVQRQRWNQQKRSLTA